MVRVLVGLGFGLGLGCVRFGDRVRVWLRVSFCAD